MASATSTAAESSSARPSAPPAEMIVPTKLTIATEAGAEALIALVEAPPAPTDELRALMRRRG